MSTRLGVVLLNLGGPATQEDVRPYLQELFSDSYILEMPAFVRKPLAWYIAKKRAPESRANYAKLGGGSPILAHTTAQASALEAELRRRGHDVTVTVCMRAWKPRSGTAARALKDAGVQRGVMLPLYPQFARPTTQSAFEDFEAAWRRLDRTVPWGRVRSFPEHPAYVDAVAHDLRRVLDAVPAERRATTAVFFSAHGLPVRQARHPGETYEAEVQATVRRVLEAIAWKGRWHLGYQSRVGPMEWLKPDVEEVIDTMVREGTTDAVVYPIAFTSDHSETLFELDMLYGDRARAKGLGWHRVAALNDGPKFIAALADLVEGAIP